MNEFQAAANVSKSQLSGFNAVALRKIDIALTAGYFVVKMLNDAFCQHTDAIIGQSVSFERFEWRWQADRYARQVSEACPECVAEVLPKKKE
jgi:hypothetical protein